MRTTIQGLATFPSGDFLMDPRSSAQILCENSPRPIAYDETNDSGLAAFVKGTEARHSFLGMGG